METVMSLKKSKDKAYTLFTYMKQLEQLLPRVKAESFDLPAGLTQQDLIDGVTHLSKGIIGILSCLPDSIELECSPEEAGIKVCNSQEELEEVQKKITKGEPIEIPKAKGGLLH